MAIAERDTKIVPEGNQRSRAVGVFKSREDVEHVISALKSDGYDMDRVSLLARNVDKVEGSEDLQTGNAAAEGAGAGATTGTVLGGLTGFLIGVGVLAIPGIGPVLAAGAEISALGSTLAGAGVGAATGGIVGALVGMGIPEERAKAYEDRVKAGDYLLIVSGDGDRLNRVETIMRDRNVEEFEIFGGSATTTTTATTPVDTTATTTTGPVTGTTRPGVVTNVDKINHSADPEVVVVDKRDGNPDVKTL
jgi:hypothetical protein